MTNRSMGENAGTLRAVGLIGGGYWGRNLARNFAALGALRVVCDQDPATLALYGADYGDPSCTRNASDLFNDPETTAVAIAAPAVHHYKLAKAALEAGKDVFVEKPLCLDVAEAVELGTLARRVGRILMVGHLLRYHPCVLTLQRLIERGELGQLHYIASSRLNLGKIRREENALWSFAPHDISVILALVGNQLPSLVRSTGESYITPGVADTTLTVLQFGGNVRAHVYVSWLNPFKEQKLTVVGSRGMAVFDDTKPWAEKLVLHQDYLTWNDGLNPAPRKGAAIPVAVAEAEPLREECRHFLNCCVTREGPRTDADEGVRVLRVLQAAQKSLDANGEGVDSRAGAVATYFAHPTAVVDKTAQVGVGTKIWHFSHVMAGAKIGPNCNFGQNVVISSGVEIGENVKVQNNVSIYAGTTIENDVFLGPSCVLTNVTNPRAEINRRGLYETTRIKKGASVGANATIVCGVTLGRYAFVAAGAVVTKSFPDYAFVRGVPARQVGWMSRHGHVLRTAPNGEMRCPESGYRYSLDGAGGVKCRDLDEEAPLPTEYRTGGRGYREFKFATPEREAKA